MPSPIGHSLIGLAVANLVPAARKKPYIYWLLFILFAANAPDLDFLPGWIMGDFNRFHHGISHSIGAGVIFALACALVSRLFTDQAKWVFIIALAVFTSHLVADYLGVDKVEPFGAPFLWPISQDYFLSPVSVFNPVEHGNVGEITGSVFSKIFSVENVVAGFTELAIVLPFWILTFWLSRRG